VSPIDLGVVPGLDTTVIRTARDRCYSAAVREKPFCKGGKLFRHEAPPGKNAEILYNMCSRISRDLKEFRSGAIRLGGQEP
jgi:hypothetical protein